MILKADISKTSTVRYLFLFIFICGNSKCTRIQKIKKFSGEVNWVSLALNGMLCLLDIYYDYGTRNFYIDPFDGNRSKLTGKRINEYNCDVTLSAYGWFYSIYGDPLWS